MEREREKRVMGEIENNWVMDGYVDVDGDDQVALQWKSSVRKGVKEERLEKGALSFLSHVAGPFY